ncbi:MAG: hypothetical protein H7Z16_12480 [Pyrinomonadaceae bacterium]|nr:hypothetical protein [Pyrinomonadaceae bacterium]
MRVPLTALWKKQLGCRMFRVTELDQENHGAPESRRTQLEDRLREVDQHLRSEMRARGFDPDQDDNLALTAPLATLYTERENLREELKSLTENIDCA